MECQCLILRGILSTATRAAPTAGPGAAVAQQAQPVRSERPKPERSGMDAKPSMNKSSDLDNENTLAGVGRFVLQSLSSLRISRNSLTAEFLIVDRSPLAAPRAAPQSKPSQAERPSKKGAKASEEEDDFGDTDVTSLLG